MKGGIMKRTLFVPVVLAIIFAVTHPLVFKVAGTYAQTPQIERIDVVDYGIIARRESVAISTQYVGTLISIFRQGGSIEWQKSI
jgi:hypothetical protein